MVTIREIAARCGVSVASVSKALNHAPDIGSATAERIRREAAAMGYFPNAAARSLKTNHSHNIGVLLSLRNVSGLMHEFLSTVVGSIQDTAEKGGYDITLITRQLRGGRMSYLEHCQYRNCDGVVIVSVPDFEDPEILELSRSEVKVVTIDYVFEGCAAVLSDNRSGMRELTRYAISAGCRRPALISGEETNVTAERRAGFFEACREAGIEVPKERILRALFHDPELSAKATMQLLSLNEKPDCIFYPDDYSYLGGMTALEKRGLRVPEDICCAGYDGIGMASCLRPPLTSYRQDGEGMGAEAARLLLNAIETGARLPPERSIVSGRLLPGGTIRPAK